MAEAKVVASRHRRIRWKRHLIGYAFISPWIVGFVVFAAAPILASIYLSFADYDLLSPPEFVGLENYQRLLNDPSVPKALFNTAFYAFISVPLKLAVALAMALVLNMKLRGVTIFRGAYYLPTVVPAVTVVIVWMWIFNPNFGPVNMALGSLGISGPGWFWDELWSKPAIIIMSLWNVGTQMVVFLAGLQTVPEAMHEAASIDGAGRLRRFWHVTLPMLSPVIFFNAVVGIIGSWQVFTPAFIATEGGPRESTLFLVLHLYRHAFQNFRMGYASTLAWTLFLIVLVFTIIQFRAARSWVFYEAEGQ